ncbi:MAG: ABC transporter substrate-binding protein [Pseudorhodoplanes sp.]|uniref:ABC transporter substrate-binding protein n=1 Tax=Pseudorhodoplanes sp. TaxID=1934341 RepID=UPI003D096785
MRRRDFLYALGAAMSSPGAAWSQPSMPVLGFLSSGAAGARQGQVAMLFRGLADGGYVEGKNLAVTYRWADDRYDRLPALAEELVRLRVSVIAATGGPVTALAARKATATIPIVFTAVSDPQGYKLVASLNRPGGNVTGTGGLVAELDAKRLELLREVVPGARRIGALFNPNRPGVDGQINDLAAAAATAGQRLVVFKAGTKAELDAVFAAGAGEPVDALVVSADPFFNSQRGLLVELLVRHRIPAIYQWSEFASAGGLISYGPSVADAYEKAGSYVARILKGEKPADLPVLRPTKFDLVINLKAAGALGLVVPPAVLARADEVIE